MAYMPQHTHYAVFVPTTAIGADLGSAVVAPVAALVSRTERVLVHYESNRFGAENMHRFVEKVHHAAGRADAHYPTIAKALVRRDALHRVALYDLRLGLLRIADAAALARWAGEGLDCHFDQEAWQIAQWIQSASDVQRHALYATLPAITRDRAQGYAHAQRQAVRPC